MSIPDAEKYLVLVGMACKSSDAILRVETLLDTNKKTKMRVESTYGVVLVFPYER